MSNSINQAKDRFELEQLKTAIQQELDLNCEVLPISSEVPINTLVVQFEKDQKNRDRVASIMFMPLDDSHIESLKLLQFYCQTPIIIGIEFISIVTRLLSIINLKIPIGAFCLNPDNNNITFKYVYTLGKFQNIESKEFLELLLLWMFALDSMSNLIEEVAQGNKTLEVATQILNR